MSHFLGGFLSEITKLAEDGDDPLQRMLMANSQDEDIESSVGGTVDNFGYGNPSYGAGTGKKKKSTKGSRKKR